MKRFSVIIMSLLVIGFIAFGCAPQLSDRKDEGWITLIDGPPGAWKTGTEVGSSNWAVVDGVVQADKRTGKGPASSSRRTPTATFRSEPNSGSATTPTAASTCVVPMPRRSPTRAAYEANIYDQRPDPSFGTGAIMHFTKVSPMPKAGGKWNTYEITAKGPQLIVVLNGTRTAEAKDTQFTSGPIALQHGAGVGEIPKGANQAAIARRPARRGNTRVDS